MMATIMVNSKQYYSFMVFVLGFILHQVIRTSIMAVIPYTWTDHYEPNIAADPVQGESERERIQQLYTAAKLLHSEYSLDWTRSLTHDLSILNTRPFYTEPRPLTCEGCNRMEAVTVVAPQDLCAGETRIDLLVQITTVPQEVEGRRAVRETWGSLTRGNTASVRYVFLFGTGYSKEHQDIVNEEAEIYDDVLQHDYKDSYYNLTYKVITGFAWASKHCPRAQFILRTATDNFINLPALTKYLDERHDEIQRVQLGRVFPSMDRFPHRDSKFYVPHTEHPHDTYPPFAIGSAFVFSMNAVVEILKAAPNIPYFALEDCWFGLLMQQIDLHPSNHDGFDVVLDMKVLGRIPSGECPHNVSFLAVHFPASWVGQLSAEPHQFLHWMWAACVKYGVSKPIN